MSYHNHFCCKEKPESFLEISLAGLRTAGYTAFSRNRGKQPEGINVSSLTLNQIILLLDIRRGTFEEHRHLGTLSDDLRLLRAAGVIEPRKDTIVWGVTPKGRGLATHIEAEACWQAVVEYGTQKG